MGIITDSADVLKRIPTKYLIYKLLSWVVVQFSDNAPNIMYYTYTAKDLPVKKDSYVSYVDSLRAHFTIRIEVKGDIDRDMDQLRITHASMRDKLEKYLLEHVNKNNYHMQRDSGYHGLVYTWFMDKEDALAFALKFGGKVV